MRLNHTSTRRRGTVTVIVVAFLALLLVLGLSFAFYALRESEESRVYRDSVNGGATGVTPTSRTSSGTDAPPEPDAIANVALGTLVYGSSDDLTGAFNVLRTHELARTIYGWNPKFPSPDYGYNQLLPAPFPPPDPRHAATQPFNGIGEVPTALINPALPAQTVNWTWMTDPAYLAITQGLMYDPDNNYARNPQAGPPLAWSYNPASSTNLTGTDRYWARNADYTYPDKNNLFLAAVDPKSGRVLVPSFHRPWLVNNVPPPANPAAGPTPVPQTFDPADTNPWTNLPGRFQMLRPRPVDHQWPRNSGISEWRYPTMNPDGTYGDVELLAGKASGRQLDAMWLDLDLPVRTWRGKSYKPLVAMLVFDLDGRINLNTAGNFYPVPNGMGGVQYVHGSNQGVGPWEVNPSRVMLSYPDPMNPFLPVPNSTDGAQLTVGTNNPNLPVTGGHARYGLSWLQTAGGPQPIWAPIKQYGQHTFNGDPSSAAIPRNTQQYGENVPPGNSGALFYGSVDFNGRNGTGQFAADDPQGHYTHFTFGPPFVGPPNQPASNSRFDNGYYLTTAAGQPPYYDERSDHPSLFNPYLVRARTDVSLPFSPGRVIPNRTFGVDELRHLNAKFNYGDGTPHPMTYGSYRDYPASQLALLAPNTLGYPAYRANQLNPRFATTVLSTDFDLPGAGPTSIVGWGNSYQGGLPPQGQGATQPSGSGAPVNPLTPADLSANEYDESFRSRLAGVLGPVDLNRKLTDYRFRIDFPLGFDFGPGQTPRTNVGDWQRAINDRVLLAADILKRLRQVTGIDPTGTSRMPGSVNRNAERWLAQLAVNIVDFIDNDDCVTPFKWTDPNGGAPFTGLPVGNDQVQTLGQFNNAIKNDWVFGFERPRVNINEAYLRVENDPNDPLPLDMNTGKRKAQDPYDMRMWLELHNPLTPASPNEQLMFGPEGYANPANDDNTHGGYRAALRETPQGNGVSAYRVLLYKINGDPTNPGATGPDPMGMWPATGDNVAGLPTNAPPLTRDAMSNQQLVVTFDRGSSNGTVVDDSGGTVIQPNLNAQYRDQSFYLVGPQLDQQNAMVGMGMGKAQVPDAQAHLTTTQLQAQVAHDEFDTVRRKPRWSPGFVLQRLACPALPPGPTNPYITIDYWNSDPVAVYDRLKYDNQGPSPASMTEGTPPDWNTTFAWGRRQPYDAVIKYTDMTHYRQSQGAPQMGKINFSFGQHNGSAPVPAPGGGNWMAGQTLQVPFLPLVHFDRIALNPTELFHVVAVKPHELTHVYYESMTGNTPVPSNGVTTGTNRLKFTADWLDHAGAPGTSFLYRALGALRTPTPMLGLGMGGRVPGKININTIFAQEVFEAICDAPQAVTPAGPNRFGQNDVMAAWQQLLQARQGAMGPAVPPIQPTDRPFVGAATPVDSATWDRMRTPLRPNMLWQMGATPKGSETYSPGAAPNGHASALEKYEMLSKVYNQFTTRSNCFAVYMMFGYFEVKNPGPYNEANRPVLGKELGTDDGTVTRHKYFAVIDRTNLSIEAPTQLVNLGQPVTIRQGQPPVYFSYQPDVPQPSAVNNFQVVPDPVTLVVPPPMAGVPVNVRIPSSGVANDPVLGQVVLGEYDGTPWKIAVNPPQPQFRAQLVIDTGARQEGPVPAVTARYDAVTSSAIVTVQLSGNIAHDRGVVLRLMNPDPTQPASTPGNPGPQPGFNYKSPRYAPVVRYVEQLR